MAVVKNGIKAGLLFGAVIFVAACRGDRDPVQSDTKIPDGAQKLCGSNQIYGTTASSVSSGSCGIQNPVSVQFVNGVKLSTPALVNCGTAKALSAWVSRSVQPEAKEIGKSVSELNVMASYSCRTRNHKKGARLSEHSYGNAIDIGGFTFTDGDKVTVLNDYYKRPYKGFFAKVRKGACGIFGTVLGPGSDAYHDNHFHFDIARYSSGPYCK